MTPKDELAASLNIFVLFVSFCLSIFEIRDYLVDAPFDKVKVLNDCSEKEVQDHFLFFFLLLHSNTKYAIGNYFLGMFACA